MKTSITRRPANAAEILSGSDVASSLPRHVLAKWLWHYQVLLSLQERLSQAGDRRQRNGAEPLELHSLNQADSATDEFDHDLALSQLSAEQDALYEICEALCRIRDGTYGVCEQTGKPIPAARLRAIPWTRFSLGTERQLEKKGLTAHAHLGKLATVRAGGQNSLAPNTQAENGETSLPLPNDEELSRVFVPPGRRGSQNPNAPFR